MYFSFVHHLLFTEFQNLSIQPTAKFQLLNNKEVEPNRNNYKVRKCRCELTTRLPWKSWTHRFHRLWVNSLSLRVSQLTSFYNFYNRLVALSFFFFLNGVLIWRNDYGQTKILSFDKLWLHISCLIILLISKDQGCLWSC